jgi:uncharacterized protein YoxC
MTPLAQAVVVICVAVVSVVLVVTLLSLRKTAVRAESVLHLVEREIRPMSSQLEGLTAELKTLTRNANQELERASVIVSRVDDLSLKAARLVGAFGGFTRAGQVVGVAAGVKKGLDAFLGRLRGRHL